MPGLDIFWTIAEKAIKVWNGIIPKNMILISPVVLKLCPQIKNENKSDQCLTVCLSSLATEFAKYTVDFTS